MKVNKHEAKPQLLAAREGEEVAIAHAGEPYPPLVPCRKAKGTRKLGGLEGQIRLAPDFDKTPPEVIEAFWTRRYSPTKRNEVASAW